MTVSILTVDDESDVADLFRQHASAVAKTRRNAAPGGRCHPAALTRRIAASSTSSGGPQNSARVGPSRRRFSRNRKFHSSCGQTRLPTP